MFSSTRLQLGTKPSSQCLPKLSCLANNQPSLPPPCPISSGSFVRAVLPDKNRCWLVEPECDATVGHASPGLFESCCLSSDLWKAEGKTGEEAVVGRKEGTGSINTLSRAGSEPRSPPLLRDNNHQPTLLEEVTIRLRKQQRRLLPGPEYRIPPMSTPAHLKHSGIHRGSGCCQKDLNVRPQ